MTPLRIRLLKRRKVLGGPLFEAGTVVEGHASFGGYVWASYGRYPLVLSSEEYEVVISEEDFGKLLGVRHD